MKNMPPFVGWLIEIRHSDGRPPIQMWLPSYRRTMRIDEFTARIKETLEYLEDEFPAKAQFSRREARRRRRGDD